MTSDPPVDPRTPTFAPPVSPAARERVIALLTDRYAQDHLSLDEFERRAAAAYSARTPDDLATLTADLGDTGDTVPGVRPSLPAMNVGVVLVRIAVRYRCCGAAAILTSSLWGSGRASQRRVSLENGANRRA